MERNGNGNGVRIPGWVWPAAFSVVALVGFGYNIGSRMGAIDTRLCRIERAVHIEPWVNCPQVEGK